MACFHDLYDQIALSKPESIAVVCVASDRQRFSYAAVRERSLLLAAGLNKYAKSFSMTSPTCSQTIAIYLPRTHPDFVPLLIAASRVGLPFVLLSTDLPDRALQESRNAFAIKQLKPCLCISMSSAPAIEDVVTVTVFELLRDAHQEAPSEIVVSRSEIFSFMFTGGTSRTKCVQVTHAMVLHERTAYYDLWQPSSQPAVVLAHTSVYWGASALGQLSIALAYGGAVVWTEASEAADLRRIVSEEHVNILGVVPDHLDLLAPESPIRELPNVEVVFTWGERLPRRTADRWRSHPRAVLRELLIATEYWLCLWADPLDDSELRIVKGTKLLVLSDQGSDAAIGEVGELMISGPMVMAGYLGDIGDAPDPFYTHRGERFFRTRDLVRRTRLGVIFKGRADMMTKHKGKWVDMMVIEDQVCQLEGVHAVKVMADPVTENFHAFVVLDKNSQTALVLKNIRLLLPPRLQLWLVPELPRHPVTRKVDTNKLSRILSGLPTSWPICGNLGFPNGSEPVNPNLCQPHGSSDLRQRLSTLACWQVCWQLVAFGTAWAVADGGDLGLQLSLLAVYVPSVVFVNEALPDRNRTATTAIISGIWVLAVVFCTPPSLERLAKSTLSCIALTYSFLTLTYADGNRSSSLPAKIAMSIIDELPFWKFGAFICVSLGQHLPGLAGMVNKGMLWTCAGGGMIVAAWRQRFFSWPIVFWSISVGNQLGRDCHRWLDPGFWVRNARSRSYGLFSYLLWFPQRGFDKLCDLIPSQRNDPAALPAEPETVVDPNWQPPEPRLCRWCNANIDGIRWPAHDEKNWPLCNSCGATASANAETTAADWLSTNVVACQQAEADEPMQKVRPRTNSNGLHSPRAEPLHKVRRTETNNNGSDKVQMDSSEPGDATRREEYFTTEQYEAWWWRNKTSDVFDLDAKDEQRLLETLSFGAPCQNAEVVPVPPEMRLLCTVIGDIEPLMKPVHLKTVLIGLDSLQVARLTNALRIQFGIALTVQQIREAKTVESLAAVVAKADVSKPEAEPTVEKRIASSINQEYAVWYSPGQYRAMGAWVLRSEEKLDHDALVKASQQLADRHEALRALPADPLRYMSILYDNAVVFTLYAPFLDRGPLIARWFRRILSKAFAAAWPRVKVHSREELYRTRSPDSLSPLEIVQIDSGQDELERALRQRRSRMVPPGAITAFEVNCYLCDVWAMEGPLWRGRFVIMRAPDQLVVPEDVSLVYVDAISKEWGPLIGPGCREWQVPPYGFPALFFVPLSSGAIIWIRMEKRDELRICYREKNEVSTYNRRFVAFRAAPQRPRDCHPPVVINFLSIGVFHCFADGNCYLPLVQDFLNLYGAAKGLSNPRLPAISSPFAELQRRLFDTFHSRANPMRSSLRGSLFGYRGAGYGYCLGIGPSAVSAITRVSVHFGVPLDVALLGCVVCAMARADRSDFCDFTLYAPMRDGAAEAMSVGLFSDWRDLYASVDFEMATVLGTILQLYQKFLNRQWTVFNALRKPERAVVNIQPLDFEKRTGFKNLGENMWRDGDQLNVTEQRGNQLNWAQQPATFVIEQQDEDTWWVLANVGSDLRPAPWMRSFVEGFRDAMYSFLYDPLTLVHRPLPDDDTILRSYTTIGKPISLSTAV